MKSKREIGQAGEDLALAHLEKRGLELAERNYLCKMGEIDLIMRDKDACVFVEVRFRANTDHGDGADTVTHYKQRKIIKAATHYLVSINKYDKIPCRFDVVSISQNEDTPCINWIQDAFQAF